MDRRQIKTRNAIFASFIGLISEKNYTKITIQEIINGANIGRSTFYSHFQTKDDLLDALCEDVFQHILSSISDLHHNHGHSQHSGMPNSVICHTLQHIKENDHNILTLLSCENNDFFLQYFKEGLREIMYINFIKDRPKTSHQLPDNFVLNHITSSFVGMIQWWIKNEMRESPETLDAWFTLAITQGC